MKYNNKYKDGKNLLNLRRSYLNDEYLYFLIIMHFFESPSITKHHYLGKQVVCV